MKRLTGFAVGDATRRPHYIHGPGVKKDDLLQRLGKCEDASNVSFPRCMITSFLNLLRYLR